ncbi:zinc ribbon domain-containing protein [Candidatus Poribacteria bacterium]|nr:zinc ribbon domain-containing protein [Candidatus Poribacteria bacterium]
MPTYEYECEKCGHNFEKFQSITAEPIKKCPKCGGKVKRLIGAGAGVIFKGPGFYATDYRSDGYRQKAKQENSTKKIPDTKSSDKKSSDSKDKS